MGMDGPAGKVRDESLVDWLSDLIGYRGGRVLRRGLGRLQHLGGDVLIPPPRDLTRSE
jgi:hypothetical protein